MTPGLDLLTIGRVSVDLYAEQVGVPLGEARTFAKSIGGSPTNVAVAAARLGCRSAVITAVGDDEFGAYVRDALRGFGVDTRFVGSHPIPADAARDRRAGHAGRAHARLLPRAGRPGRGGRARR